LSELHASSAAADKRIPKDAVIAESATSPGHACKRFKERIRLASSHTLIGCKCSQAATPISFSPRITTGESLVTFRPMTT
jgi:hypothetical protein